MVFNEELNNKESLNLIDNGCNDIIQGIKFIKFRYMEIDNKLTNYPKTNSNSNLNLNLNSNTNINFNKSQSKLFNNDQYKCLNDNNYCNLDLNEFNEALSAFNPIKLNGFEFNQNQNQNNNNQNLKICELLPFVPSFISIDKNKCMEDDLIQNQNNEVFFVPSKVSNNYFESNPNVLLFDIFDTNHNNNNIKIKQKKFKKKRIRPRSNSDISISSNYSKNSINLYQKQKPITHKSFQRLVQPKPIPLKSKKKIKIKKKNK